MQSEHKIRPLVFWPTFLLLIVALIYSFIDKASLIAHTSAINSWILQNFSWLFSLSSFFLLVLCVCTYFSKLGNLRIGGDDATPLLPKGKWFAVTLCTTVAVGVLFWTTAEPIYHLHYPSLSLGAEASTVEAAQTGMSSMFLHWTFTPYAIYTVPAIVFALVFYNLKLPFSTISMLKPWLRNRANNTSGQVIDAIALFALVAGMASSLGTGALSILGGINQFTETQITAGPLGLGLVMLAIVTTFILSATSGIQRGIAKLSTINTYLLMFLGLFLLLAGPTTFILAFGMETFGIYLSNFFRLSLLTGASYNDPWVGSWTTFYWAVWFAWAPISAMFLGKIARGYTVKEVIMVNFILPASATAIWIMIFSGTAIHIDMAKDFLLKKTLETQGVENVLYQILHQMPLSYLMIMILLFVAFLNYVTAADSNTDAISNLCTENYKADTHTKESVVSMGMKIVWGIIIGLVSWIMTSFGGGIEGIKMMSNLGGLPAMFVILGCAASLIVFIRNPEKLSKKPD